MKHRKIKELPKKLDFPSLFMSFDDYDYFAEGSLAALAAPQHCFSLAHAWVLADCAMLSYASPGIIDKALVSAAATTVTVVERDDLRLLYARWPKFQVVSFRGTVITSWHNLLTDVQFFLGAFGRQGRVHQGFYAALKRLWKAMYQVLATVPQDLPIYFCGHSLGAALALLACQRYPAAHKAVYTFGSPRVGDAQFAHTFQYPAFRVVVGNDVVTHLPPELVYRHVGKLIYFNHQGHWVQSQDRWEMAKMMYASHLAHIQTVWQHWRRGQMDSIPFDWLVDHSPHFYSIYLWNAFVQNQSATLASD